ncbi:hypothetical protein RD110_18605 [Rhodoferax koreense]|uniref:DUF2635 domain-containing protein n=1 Tax=Rhodoferax koreensis TaxID=1842727 RepID=A0A1P8JYY2_9BURK|nr:DUF2635 domain-containing protein [Rhodoferax koreense]APW38966.1 hypothetical protein RD110_18605 [Rhodoferax koreense]
MFLKPAPNITVPDPDRGGTLPPEGREVTPSTYWHRRIESGDVEELTAEVEPVQTSAQDEANTPT